MLYANSGPYFYEFLFLCRAPLGESTAALHWFTENRMATWDSWLLFDKKNCRKRSLLSKASFELFLNCWMLNCCRYSIEFATAAAAAAVTSAAVVPCDVVVTGKNSGSFR